MYGKFFILIWCTVIQPSLMQIATNWELVTSPPIVFGNKVELRCTVTGIQCCSMRTRIWSKGNIQILINGVTPYNSKYVEKLDEKNNQFSLIINNLDKYDVDMYYTCIFGSTATPKELTQNNSFEYHPTESCPMKIDNGELVGTLNVTMAAPYPSVTAQYGSESFTSYLHTTIAPVTGSPKFYTIVSYIKTKANCSNKETFTLSVLTGVNTTNICNSENLCTKNSADINCSDLCKLLALLCLLDVIAFIVILYRKIKKFEQLDCYVVHIAQNACGKWIFMELCLVLKVMLVIKCIQAIIIVPVLIVKGECPVDPVIGIVIALIVGCTVIYVCIFWIVIWCVCHHKIAVNRVDSDKRTIELESISIKVDESLRSPVTPGRKLPPLPPLTRTDLPPLFQTDPDKLVNTEKKKKKKKKAEVNEEVQTETDKSEINDHVDAENVPLINNF